MCIRDRYSVLPGYRHANAMQFYLKQPNARVTQTYLFQLIRRLNQPILEYTRTECVNTTDIEFAQLLRARYQSDTGLSLENEINEEEVLKEIENIVRFSGCLDVNARMPDPDAFMMPLREAIRTGNVRVVQLLVSLGATDFDIIPHEADDKPDIFAYALDICPHLYQDENEFKNLVDHLTNMKRECSHQTGRVIKMDVCENLLNERRKSYLLDGTKQENEEVETTQHKK